MFQTVEHYNSLWPFYADFAVNYSYNETARDTFVKQLCMSYPDQVGDYDKGSGYTARKEQLEMSKVYETFFPLPLAVATSKRLFMPGKRFNLVWMTS